MDTRFDLEKYLTDGVEHFVKSAMRATLKNPRESAFLLRYAASARQASQRRHALKRQGEHAPSFLIASITAQCNLRCAGCYAHANGGGSTAVQLSAGEWARIFGEASALGVAMILLAGGEPLVRRDVLAEAAKRPDIAFPVFTNGTMVDEEYLRLFTEHRNLVPIVSIEGDKAATDGRRGEGVWAQADAAMGKMQKKGLLFGASITVTKQNLQQVTALPFVENLRRKGSKALLFVEYVPVDMRPVALEEPQQEELARHVAMLRNTLGDSMIVVSFPGDEKEAEGCLAAGRGFFHINAAGGAEPCPFSPYSDTSLRDVSLREALRSPLFVRLQKSGLLQQEHTGGCVLFRQEDEVKRLAGGGFLPDATEQRKKQK